MKSLLPRTVGVALFALAAAFPVPALEAAAPSSQIESLTLKEIISRLDQVDFDLQGLEGHVGELRKDVQASLGRGAAIRVFDIGVGLVRDRVMLNRMPQVIGAMQRESRWDSYQRSRQEEQMERQRELLGKHGNLYRVVEGYAADVEEKFGIKLKDFFKAMEAAVARGDTNVEAVLQQYRDAVVSGDATRAEQLTDALSSGSAIPPPSRPGSGSSMGPGGGSSTVVSAEPHPTRPGFFIVRYADGREEVVRGQDNGDGTVTLTLPNGQTVTTSITGGGASGGAGGPGSQGAGGPGGFGGPPGGQGSGTTPGSGGGLAPNVRQAPDGGFIVTETLPDGQQVERYFPANFQGVGTKYLGDQGGRLTEEIRETLDPGTGQIQKGQSIRWRFTITPVGQTQEGGGVRATFKLSDSSGQAGFQVTGWKISSPDGSQLAAGTGEEAAALVTQSGNYRVEFSGRTEWGSEFRIEINQPIAVQ
ncbi:MAG: hypothetical protein ACREIA_19705 [Opitutaceae bacterium]